MDLATSLSLSAPDLLLTVAGIVLMMAAAWGGDRSGRAINWIAIFTLAAAALLAAGQFNGGGDAYGGLYRADGFAAFAKMLIFPGAAVALMMARGFFVNDEELRPEYPVLVLFAAAGMGIMVSAANLLTLYIGLELNSLASYVLASFHRRDMRSAEAGLKYFVLGALASGMLLYGISLLYGFSATTSYEGIAEAVRNGVGIGELFGLVFVLAGIAFKISAVPFHMWTPDVYEGAPTPVTAFFASAPKVAAMAMLLRLAFEGLGPAVADWRQIIVFMALASIVLGAVGAVGQTNIKRLLAYSSINNVGFALVGLAAGTEKGVAATLSYLAIYIVVVLGSFAAVLQMRDENGNHVEDIAALSGLSQRQKALAAALAIFMFSLAGIPPLFGFWAKFLVFDAAVEAGLIGLAAFGIAASVIGAYYYIKIVKIMFFDEAAAPFKPMSSGIEAAIITTSAALMVIGYLLIPMLGDATAIAARALF